MLGQLLAEQQRFPPALDHLRRATRLDSDNPEYPYTLGLALRLHGDLDAADAQFRAALAKNPDHALARRSLGLVLRQKGDTTAAATELRRAATEMPEDPQGRYLLGAVLLKMGDTAGAVAELREAIRLNPMLTEARVTLAQALAKEGQKDAALQQQAEVQRLNAEKADFGRMLVLLDSSAALRARGDLARAVAQGREAVALGPTSAEAHVELGLALSELDGSRAEAETAFRQAIALDPGHARAYRALARLLELRGDQAAARAARPAPRCWPRVLDREIFGPSLPDGVAGTAYGATSSRVFRPNCDGAAACIRVTWVTGACLRADSRGVWNRRLSGAGGGRRLVWTARRFRWWACRTPACGKAAIACGAPSATPASSFRLTVSR